MRNIIFALIVLVVTYLIYIYPIGLLLHLLFSTDIHQPYLLLLSGIVSVFVFVYLRTHISHHHSCAVLHIMVWASAF